MDDEYYGPYDDEYDEPPAPIELCEVCGVPYVINGRETHVHVYPAKPQPGLFARLFGSGYYCKICGHDHGAHLQPWVVEWAQANMDAEAWRRLATLVAVDFITGAGPLF